MRSLALWLTGAVALLLAAAAPALAADGARFALVINQVDYQTLTPLPDTDTEAADIKASLTQLGFDVTSVRDLTVDGDKTHPAFKQVLTDFRRKVAASPGAIAFIYYTGHGMADPTEQGGGENYLLGTDADIRMAADLPASGIKLSDVTNNLSRSGAKALIIVLDACRDTPTIGKGVTKGLVPITPEENTLIAYSTDLGRVAETGVYAPILAKELLKPGLKITDVFTNVQIDVSQTTGQKQRPWSNNRIYDAICLTTCNLTVNVQPPAVDAGWQREQAVWNAARDCTDYQAYLTDFPGGAFVKMAQGRLAAPACATPPATQVVNVTPVTTTPPATAPAVAPQMPAPLAGSKLAAKQPEPWYDDDTDMLVDSCDTMANADHDTDRVGGAVAVLDRDMKPPAAIAACKRALDKYSDNRHLAYNLARAYQANRDYGNARAWYEQAAAAGSGAAMYGMGSLYFNGNGVDQDAKQALAWFQKGADAGNSESMLYLGIVYDSGLTGDDDAANAAQARKWYRAAVQAGNTGAQALLDMMPPDTSAKGGH